MTAIILLVLQASIILSVFAIGLKATFADATFLFRRPGHLLRALLSMNVLMPLTALAVGAPFDLHPAVKIALVALSVSPTPPVLPKKALKAGGAEAYTIGLLVAAAALSIVVIPLSMEMFERLTGVSLVMRARCSGHPGTDHDSGAAPHRDRGSNRRARECGSHGRAYRLLASVLLVVCAMPVVIGLGRTALPLMTDGTVLSLAGFALAGCFIGHALGGPEPDNRPVLALATASRHPAVAMAIAHANFPEQRLAGAAVVPVSGPRGHPVCPLSLVDQAPTTERTS